MSQTRGVAERYNISPTKPDPTKRIVRILLLILLARMFLVELFNTFGCHQIIH
jgi:hypothetical protein